MADDKVKDALDRYQEASEGWSDNYREASKDLEFIDSDNQWDDEAKKYLKGKNQLALTLNKIPKFINRVSNQIRLNTPSIKVDPMDSGADVETAEIIQGLIRNIEYVSGADSAYDTAVTDAIKCSIGFFRIDHDYVAPDTFEQHILVKRVVNPLSVLIDPSSIESDGSDSKYGFITDTLKVDAFKKLYKDANPVSFDVSSYDKQKAADGEIRIAEHFYIEEEEIEIGLVVDPVTGEHKSVILEEGYDLNPTKTRTIKKNKVYRCKVSGAEVLEESVFPSAYIPLIPVYGEEHYINGERHLYSLVRNMKEAQRLYNLGKSLEVSLLKKAPKNQWVAAEGQIHGYENMWKNPDAVETLIYKAADVKGTLIGQPRREQPVPVPPAVMALSVGAMEDLKDISGIYDSSLGQKSNETSGKAIQERQNEGELATAHFEDNLRKSIRHCGRIIVDMIPRIYDTERIVRVIGKEDEQKLVKINGQNKLPEGQKRAFDIGTGKYDVSVTTGKSFSSKRAETAALMGDVMRGNPELMGVMGDLMFKYMDVAGADQISARLKKTIPPQLLEDSEREDGEQQPDPEKMQMAQALEQAQMQISQMSAELQNKNAEQENNRKKLEIEEFKAVSESKIKMAELHLNANQPEKQTSNSAQPEAQSEQQAMPMDLGEDALIALINQRREEKQQAMLKQQMDMEAEQMRRDEDARKEQEEAVLKAQMTTAIVQSIHEVKASLDGLTQAVQTPKQVVRNEHGQVVGVQ